jgi:phage protein D
MAAERIRIELAGADLADVYQDLTGVEVELDDDLPGMFRLELPLAAHRGRGTALDDPRFRIWNPSTIAIGFDSDLQTVLTGRITHVRPRFEADPDTSTLEVWGLDESVTLDRAERRRAWPGARDSDIAAEIFAEHGLAAQVEPTTVVHDPTVSTVMQRESDWRFLRRLAARNGYGCWVDHGTGFFAPLDLAGDPQTVLAVHFGAATTIARMSFEVDATTPTMVAMTQLDRTHKRVLEARADAGDQRRLGAEPSPAGLATTVLSGTVAADAAEMTSICTSLAADQAWFVTGEGEVAAGATGVVLQPRRTVVIKGVGELFSGTYLVTHVTHALSASGYVQRFRVKRNGLGVLGTEDFAGTAALSALVEGGI